MLKRMVGCAFSSGSSSSRASSTSRAVSSYAATTDQATAVASAAVAPAPAWAPRSPTREELEARRSAERKFITDNDSTETDLWYLIDVEWLSEWKRFVLRGGPLPGSIRNDSMLDARTGKPRQGLELVAHYRGVNATIWKYWVQRYGGGPAIRRGRLDLYAPPVPESGTETAFEEEDPLDKMLAQQLQQQQQALGAGSVAPLGEISPNVTASYEELSKPGKAGQRRSFSDLLKGYRGGGRSSRSSTPKATGDAIITSGASSSKSARTQIAKNSHAENDDAPASEVSSPSSDERSGMNFFVRETDACIVTQPMDGSCLFHSLSYGVDDGSDASSLRHDICRYIGDNPDMVIAGTALKDWIKFDTGGKVATYAAEMAGGTWGGGIEIEAFTRLKDVNVHVFETCPGGYRRICCFDSSDDQRTVGLLYQGREHYDALVVNEASGKWVPRTALASHAGA